MSQGIYVTMGQIRRELPAETPARQNGKLFYLSDIAAAEGVFEVFYRGAWSPALTSIKAHEYALTVTLRTRGEQTTNDRAAVRLSQLIEEHGLRYDWFVGASVEVAPGAASSEPLTVGDRVVCYRGDKRQRGKVIAQSGELWVRWAGNKGQVALDLLLCDVALNEKYYLKLAPKYHDDGRDDLEGNRG